MRDLSVAGAGSEEAKGNGLGGGPAVSPLTHTRAYKLVSSGNEWETERKNKSILS